MSKRISVTFIHSSEERDIQAFIDFVKNTNSVNAFCVNYIEIQTRLTKNDYEKTSPSDVIVASQIKKLLDSILKLDHVDEIYYVLKEVKYDIVSNIIKYIEEKSNCFVEFKLITNLDNTEESLGSLCELVKLNFFK